MEDNKKNPVDRFLERSDLGELESSVAARLVNGKQQLDETQAALQRLRDEQLKIEQRFVGLSHQVKAMADLAAELQARHENRFAQTNEVVAAQAAASAG